MTGFLTLDDIDVAQKRVLVRADLNVPIKDGRVTDTTRIDRTAVTLAELADKGARVIVLSHFGRPKGGPDPKLSLQPVVAPLSAALGGRKVGFAADCVGPAAEQAVAALRDGEVLLLENLRFHPEEEANDPGFARKLAALGDVYVNDAFSTAHRAHASTEAIARLLPAAAGRLMQAELEHLANALETPTRPVCAVVGGAKISTKLDLLGNLVARVDMLVIGGGMANTFLNATGVDIGQSLCEREMADTARAIMEKAKAAGCDVVLPVDAVVAQTLKAGVATRVVPIGEVPTDQLILDLGPVSVADIASRLAGCRTLVWNGPLGAFEVPPFDAGTVAVARAAASFSYVSTAGGAFLEWLEGKDLPGVAALKDAAKANHKGTKTRR
jgi:phosphoglycerate kinase